VDPRDDSAIAALNESKEAQIVTVRDDVESAGHRRVSIAGGKPCGATPILLKDELKNDEARMTNDEEARMIE